MVKKQQNIVINDFVWLLWQKKYIVIIFSIIAVLPSLIIYYGYSKEQFQSEYYLSDEIVNEQMLRTALSYRPLIIKYFNQDQVKQVVFSNHWNHQTSQWIEQKKSPLNPLGVPVPSDLRAFLFSRIHLATHHGVLCIKIQWYNRKEFEILNGFLSDSLKMVLNNQLEMAKMIFDEEQKTRSKHMVHTSKLIGQLSQFDLQKNLIPLEKEVPDYFVDGLITNILLGFIIGWILIFFLCLLNISSFTVNR